MTLTEPDLPTYLSGSLEILRRGLDLYKQGDTVFYRVLAVELRLLLCDTTRRHDTRVDLALLPRLYPHLTLPPLAPSGAFDPSAPPLPLHSWLQQDIRTGLTLRDLIRIVCDQDGGAHIDQRRTLPLPPDRADWIIRIAWVVLENVSKMSE